MKDGRLDILSLTDQVTLWNAACRFLNTPLPLAGGATARLTLVDPRPDTAFWSEDIGSGIRARLEAFDFAGLTGEAFDMDALAVLDSALAEEIARAALRMLVPLWGACSMQPCSAPQSAEIWLRADITHPSGGTSAVLLAGSQAGFVRALIARELTDFQLPIQSEHLAAVIPVRISLESGGLTMACSVLQSLRPGDCLMAGPDPDQCRLRAGKLRVEAQKINEEWKVSTMSDDPEMTATDAADETLPATEIGDIPVALAFTIAKGELPLAEIAALAPGGVFPLSLPEIGPGLEVELTVNGKQIGDGHLITIDGQPAVRIASLFGARGND
ncbi:FliM/FliN family flagellar motor switch protein [Phaeobacter sp. HF9A]|uniref:FliM/FliN family flagellar motor switch protein n=1 Tax=Phaeobacter sp. HF9A TaxID=2721561 RepID=UPI001431B799|nr:FliM/FliN family flagellar motor switch protein [Phaeobacter sp. HF9A]NIZ12004.1 hypothetical protein [Phaeobacter sp. HF9A]